MKPLAFFVIVVFAGTALAQAPKDAPKAPAQETKPAAKEAAKPAADPAKPAPMKEAAKPASEPGKQAASAGPRKPRRWNEDARHCLERGSTTDIIKCAEEYL